MATSPSAKSDVLAGISIGVLVGLLVGLSASQVVGSVLSGVLAIVGAYLGLAVKPTAPDIPVAQHDNQRGYLWRVAAFGLACALAVLVGLVIRANNLLMESPASRVQRWVQAGLTPDQAREAVLFQELGIAPQSWQIKDEAKAKSSVSALFSTEASTGCSSLARSRFANPLERANAFALHGPKWGAIAQSTALMEPKQRDELLEAAWQLLCG